MENVPKTAKKTAYLASFGAELGSDQAILIDDGCKHQFIYVLRRRASPVEFIKRRETILPRQKRLAK